MKVKLDILPEEATAMRAFLEGHLRYSIAEGTHLHRGVTYLLNTIKHEQARTGLTTPPPQPTKRAAS